MGDEDQPQKDPGPIPPEPTIKSPDLPIGEQPTHDPGTLAHEVVTRSGDGDAGTRFTEKADPGE